MTLKWVKSSYSTDDGPDCVEVAWRKSTHSTADGPDCVEVGWRKSTHSTGDGPECVEVAATLEAILIRDSKNPDGPRLTLTPAAWADFIHLTAE
ncbi:DUF397 domain-containing protein [Streptomyces sp. LNU-CPARS28]|uniref:DUF397 domain-containing protein n=1 Tax=Streptomyces sp. LNU-CPARS28 TaxID=3137371 RepID=UPI0031347361